MDVGRSFETGNASDSGARRDGYAPADQTFSEAERLVREREAVAAIPLRKIEDPACYRCRDGKVSAQEAALPGDIRPRAIVVRAGNASLGEDPRSLGGGPT